jgi:hypothetical protein
MEKYGMGTEAVRGGDLSQCHFGCHKSHPR